MTAIKTSSIVRWSVLQHGDWLLHIAATDEGLCYVGSPAAPLEQTEQWIGARLPGAALVRDDEALAPYAQELTQYLTGERRTFEAPFDVRGTAFQQEVWRALTGIPYGETRAYAEIASALGRPSAARAVGAAIGANPVLIGVPCHRVVGKSGAMTGYRGGLPMKTRLLALERS